MQPTSDFPWLQVCIILYVQAGDATAICVLFPILPYMIRDFGTAPAQIGLRVGMLGAAFSVLQMVSSPVWGRASDSIGRRPVMMVGQLATALCMIGFGLTSNFTEAILARCLASLLNGNQAVNGACTRDMVQPQHQARAFSMFGYTWAVAFAVGPMIGSMLSKPSDHIAALDDTIFSDYPYLLPCGVTAMLVLSGALCLVWLTPPKPSPIMPLNPPEDTSEQAD